MMKHRQYFAILGMITVAGLLRALFLSQGLWRDEAQVYFESGQPTLQGVLAAVRYGEWTPPLYFIFMRYWMHIAGSDAVAMKLPSLLFSLALLPVVYALGSLYFSKRAAFWATFLTTWNPWFIAYASEARTYSLTTLLEAIALLFYARGAKNIVLFEVFAFFLTCTLLAYSHYTALPFLAGLGGLAVLRAWRSLPRLGLRSFAYVGALCGTALCFMPELPAFFASHAQAAAVPSTPAPPWARLSYAMHGLSFIFDAAATNSPLYGINVSLAFSLIATFFALSIYKHKRGELSRQRLHEMLEPALLWVGLTLLFAGAQLYERYLLPHSILGILCVGWLISEAMAGPQHLKNRHVAIAALIFAVVILPTVCAVGWACRLPKSGIPAFAADLQRKKIIDHTLILASPDYLGPTFGYTLCKIRAEPDGCAGGVEIHAFPRWEHAELWHVGLDYMQAWNSVQAVPATLRNIDETFRLRSDLRYLAVTRSLRSQDMSDQIHVSQGETLLYRIKQRYRLVQQKRYPALVEPIEGYIFEKGGRTETHACISEVACKS